MQRTQVDQFDDFIDKVETAANKVVGLNNTLADSLLSVKLASGALQGCLHVVLAPGTDCDLLLLELTKADGLSLPTSEEAEELQKKPEVAAADAKLSAALATLMVTTPVDLLASPDGLAGQADFNAALQALKAALGADLAVKLSIKKASAPGAPTVATTLSKPEFKDGTEAPTYTAATLLGVAASKTAKDIYAAQADLADQVHALAHAAKGLSIAFSVLKGKVQAPPVEDADAAAAKQLTAVGAAVHVFNIQAFKLVHAGLGAAGPVSLASGVLAMVGALKAKVEGLAKEAGKEAKDAIPTITPKLDVRPDMTYDFSFEVTSTEPELELPPFPDCLPSPARFVWRMFQQLKEDMTVVMDHFVPLKIEISDLIDGAKVELGEGAAEAMEDMDPFEMATIARVLKVNLTAIAGLSAIPSAFLALGAVVVEDLKQCEVEVKKLTA